MLCLFYLQLKIVQVYLQFVFVCTCLIPVLSLNSKVVARFVSIDVALPSPTLFTGITVIAMMISVCDSSKGMYSVVFSVVALRNGLIFT